MRAASALRLPPNVPLVGKSPARVYESWVSANADAENAETMNMKSKAARIIF